MTEQYEIHEWEGHGVFERQGVKFSYTVMVEAITVITQPPSNTDLTSFDPRLHVALAIMKDGLWKTRG